MFRLLSFALVTCLLAGSAHAEIGCATSCSCPADSCIDCSCQSGPRLGCGLLAHGGWLKRKLGRGSDCCGGCFGGDACGGCPSCDCGACGRGGLFGRRHHCIDGLDRYFNCGCNGSYNYPVPPLYTYHWPGMYKAQRVTDYHSPYRFPPLRPYTDETLRPLLEETPAPGTMTMAPIIHLRSQPASYQAEQKPATAGEVESVSSRLQRLGSR